MVALDREPILNALLAVIQGATTWKTQPGRRYRDAKKLGIGEQPTASLVDTDDDESGLRGLPQKWKMKAILFVYVRTDNPDVGPTQILNPIVKAIEIALEQKSNQAGAPTPGAPGVLGLSNIMHCKITHVEKVSATDSGQGVAICDIEISAVP